MGGCITVERDNGGKLMDAQTMTQQTDKLIGDSTLHYDKLVQQHVGWIYGMARRQLEDANLAEDATQAVFLALWQKCRHLVNGQRMIGGWLARATHYACKNIRKTERRINIRQRKAAAMRREEVPLPEATAEAQRQQLLQLDAAMQKLSTSDRDVIVARYFQSQTASQVAQQFNISEAAAEKRISRAVGKLRARMARKCATLDGVAVAALLASGAGAAPAGLESRVLQSVGGAAPISPAATHAARHIAFRATHIPAIAGAAAAALALALGLVALVVPAALHDRGGYVDYVAMFNQRFGKGVTPQNNAAVPLLILFRPQAFRGGEYKET